MSYQLWHYAAESAQREPGALAVEVEGDCLTYGALDERSNRVARLLRELGIRRGNRVAILLPKSLDGVVTMHAVSKLGASYVPVDPAAPAQRSMFVIRDAGAHCLITDLRRRKQLSSAWQGDDLRVVLARGAFDGVDASLEDAGSLDGGPLDSGPATENDPAYMLYTSGSTGSPKGVIISHRNAMAFVDWGADTFGLGSPDRLSNHAPHHFDLSVFDLYAAFKVGASVHLVGDRVAPFPSVLARWIADQRITTWYSVPSALIRLLLHGGLADGQYPDLRRVLFAGEVFPVKHLRAVMTALEGARFFNLYGPTETNVITWHPVPNSLSADSHSLPIGRACANCEVFVQRSDGTVGGPGDEGELLARGPTVMLGYWGHPDRTSAVLHQDPRVSAYGAPVYRTGDLVKLDADGRTFHFLGRRDHMVKTRGYRVELGEVERVLMDHQGVKEAAVLAEPDEEVGARLKGFVVPDEDSVLTEADVVSHCAKRLPRYAVPESWTFLEGLPKTSTGKTDRVALNELEVTGKTTNEGSHVH